MFLYVIFYINYLRNLLNVFVSPTSNIRAHGGMTQMWQVYRDFFRSWKENEVCILRAFSQMGWDWSLLKLERRRYITPSKPIKGHTNDLEKDPTKEYFFFLLEIV